MVVKKEPHLVIQMELSWGPLWEGCWGYHWNCCWEIDWGLL